MKKLYMITLILASCGWSNYAISQNFEWAKRLGGSGNDKGTSIAVDLSGNVFTTGYFSGTGDFDPGIGIYNLTSAGYLDIFVSKIDAAGNFIWAKRMGGTEGDISTSIAIDINGNVYTTGFFRVAADFDPGLGIYNLTVTGRTDIFISKLDSSGNFIWVKQIGGMGIDDDFANSIAIDANQNIYVTGNFKGTSDFDPGPGTFNLTSVGAWDIFVSKLDSSGTFLWAKQIGGITGDNAASIAVDVEGNSYVTGDFNGTADFDPGIGTYTLSAGFWDIFVCKLDASGNFRWANNFGGQNTDQGRSIYVDISGNVNVTGEFNDVADFDPGAGTYNLTSMGLYDVFVLKLDSGGNFIWADQFNGTSNDYGYSITGDASGNIYTAGLFFSTVDFDPGPGTYNLTSAGFLDVFICKLDSAGHFVWAKQLAGATSSEWVNCITADAIGNVYATGEFFDATDFDPGPGIYNLTAGGVFILNLSVNPTGINIINGDPDNELSVCLNSGTGHLTFTSNVNIKEVTIINLLGQISYHSKPQADSFSMQLNEKGICFVRITTAKQTITRKIIFM